MENKRTRDQELGFNLSQIRGGMSQQALADKMREAGFDWAQATVWSVEKGKRPLRVAEAEALAHIFGIDMNGLTTYTSWYVLSNKTFAVQQAENNVLLACEAYESALRQLVIIADTLVAGGANADEVKSMVDEILPPQYMSRPEVIARRTYRRLAAPGDGPFAKMHAEAGGDDVEYPEAS